MKKIISIFMTSLCLISNLNPALALDKNNTIEDYQAIIEEINHDYNAELYILDSKEFDNSEIKDMYDDYNAYLNNMLSTDLADFKMQCIELANIESEVSCDIELSGKERSTLGTKTLTFYTGRNTMKLTYKYTGSKFDTSYKPTATVKKLNSTNYFSMTSYTGSFKNSNSTYSVVASGKIYTNYGIVNNQKFTVNFNL